MRLRSTFTLGALAALCAAAPLSAQGKFGDTASPHGEFQQAISVSPLGLAVGVIAGEYERTILERVSGVLGASHWAVEDFSITSLDLKARFYPGGAPLQGFSMSGILGLVTAREEYSDGSSDQYGTFAYGGDIGYNRLLGRLLLGVGVGLKIVDVDEPLPTGRLSIGWAF